MPSTSTLNSHHTANNYQNSTNACQHQQPLLSQPQLQQQPLNETLTNTTLNQIRSILTKMVPRLHAYEDARSAWAAGNSNVLAGIDLNNEPTMHPIDALNPGPTVNQNLSELVGSVCLYRYDHPIVSRVLDTLTPGEKTQLHELSLHSEESLEKTSLQLIFSIFEHDECHAAAASVSRHAQELLHEAGNAPLQLAKFKALVFDTPKEYKANNPALPGEPFIYFNNYKEIVEAEMQLLTGVAAGASQPLIAKDNLSQQQFAFVGAGFPLTAIILHIKTGADITLIDIDQDAVNNAHKLLNICEQLGIVIPDAMRVIHADAQQCLFYSPQEIPPVTDKIAVPVTVLDLASALPTDITAKVINECTSGSPAIRKRNVYGMPQLLYPRYSHDDKTSNYKLAGAVVPPYYPPNPETEALLMGNAGEINVNSCQLLVKKADSL